jgi:RNA-binding protein 25
MTSATPPPPESLKTTLWVGKIPAGLADADVRELLEQCGRVRSWKRGVDPKTGALKAFGFCDYATPDDAWVAMAALGGSSSNSGSGGAVGHLLQAKLDARAELQLEAHAAVGRAELRARRMREELERRMHLPPGMEDTEPPYNEAAVARRAEEEYDRARAQAAETAREKVAAMLKTIKILPPIPPETTTEDTPELQQ